MRKLGQKLLKKAAPVPRAYQKHELVREHGERQALEWLAEKLEMKSATSVSQQLRRLAGKSAIKKVPEDLKHFLEEAGVTNS
ncbi:MAG: hypothetical protein IPK22_21400 [Verrucomicrobiaceae bacterium]|nr:hypothetical protein [Verrucomicrobiaceae bacterium]